MNHFVNTFLRNKYLLIVLIKDWYGMTNKIISMFIHKTTGIHKYLSIF